MALINTTTTGNYGTAYAGDSSGTLTIQKDGVTIAKVVDAPAFSAYPSVALSLTANVDTKVVLPNESYDTANCFDTSASRFTPNVAGYYLATGIVTIGSATWGSNPTLQCQIRKNGGVVVNAEANPNANWSSSSATCIVYMNGTTDYLELYAAATSNVSAVQYGGYTMLSGCLMKAT